MAPTGQPLHASLPVGLVRGDDQLHPELRQFGRDGPRLPDRALLARYKKRIIALEKPLLIGADEKEFAKTLAYENRDVNEELAIVENTRKQMGRILAKLPPEAFQRQGVHTERGLVTLEQMLTITTRHIPHHVKFIEEKRKALGLK